MINVAYIDTPVGKVEITATENAVTSIWFIDSATKPKQQVEATQSFNTVLKEAAQQLEEYFAGTRFEFSFPLKLEGNQFKQSVWQELQKIPYGQTITYAQQANKMNNPKAIRAIAACNGSNKIGIVIPCHRVIGANGSLTGYAGGLHVKKWLLEHEAKHTNKGFQAQLF